MQQRLLRDASKRQARVQPAISMWPDDVQSGERVMQREQRLLQLPKQQWLLRRRILCRWLRAKQPVRKQLLWPTRRRRLRVFATECVPMTRAWVLLAAISCGSVNELAVTEVANEAAPPVDVQRADRSSLRPAAPPKRLESVNTPRAASEVFVRADDYMRIETDDSQREETRETLADPQSSERLAVE